MNVYVHDSGPAAAGTALAARLRALCRWLRAGGATFVVAALGDAAAGSDADADLVVPPPAEGDVGRGLAAVAGRFGPGPILVVDAGRTVDFDLAALRAEHAGNPAIATLVLVPAEAAGSARRVECDRTGRILRIVAADAGAELPLALAGAALVEPRLLAHAPADRRCDLETDLFGLVLRAGGVLSGWRLRRGPAQLLGPRAAAPTGARSG